MAQTLTTKTRPDEAVETKVTIDLTEPRRGSKWVITGLAVALVVATGILVWQVADGGPAVDPFEYAEQVRQQQLKATDDGSFARAETDRFGGLAPQGDDSYTQAEHSRMVGIAPVIDSSSEQAEHDRMSRLDPGTDSSHDQAEHDRMSNLAP